MKRQLSEEPLGTCRTYISHRYIQSLEMRFEPTAELTASRNDVCMCLRDRKVRVGRQVQREYQRQQLQEQLQQRTQEKVDAMSESLE